MTESKIYPRFARRRVEEALADTPVVLVHVPRQCGKTTLSRMVGDAAGYRYITFDDDVQLAAAQSDPIVFIADLPDKTVLDEVQRAPTLFLALKSAVDRDSRPGRFILTGSANVLLVPKLADSLAGRMEILRIHPLTQDELARRGSAGVARGVALVERAGAFVGPGRRVGRGGGTFGDGPCELAGLLGPADVGV